MSSMRLDEISRRGFLGTMAAGTAAAVLPGKEVKAFIDTFTKDVGGPRNLTILSQLLSKFDIEDIGRYRRYALGDEYFEDILSKSEFKDLANALMSQGYKGDPEYVINDWMSNGEFSGDISDAVSELVGYSTNYKTVSDIIKKNNLGVEKFFENDTELDQMLIDAYEGAFEEIHNPTITVDNIVQSAREASMPSSIIRMAIMISKIVKKAIGDTEPTPAQQAPQPVVKKDPIPQLPAPSSDTGLDGMNDIARMKDLSGIPRT